MAELARFETPFGCLFHQADDRVIGEALRLYGQWAMDEVALFAHLMQHLSGDFIDLGANVGCHTVAMATLFPACEVFALEANPATFQILAANVAVNGLANCRLFPLLVGQATDLRRVIIRQGGHDVNLGAVSFEVVQSSRQDAAIALQVAVDDIYPPARTASVIKADLEGMELQALLGLRRTLARCHPAFYFENGAQVTAGPMFVELAKLGYETFWHINQPFDPGNFRANTTSVYGGTVEIGTLCLHSEHPAIGEIRQHLTPTGQAMGDAGWHKCVALNAALRAQVQARLQPRQVVAAARGYLLDEYARSRTQAEPAAGLTDGVLPGYAELRRSMLLDIPDHRLQALLSPLIEQAALDEQVYLERHPDVAAAVQRGEFASARHHYVAAGYFEGRGV